ncbi:transmembrane protein, putative [Medicago truncatula]|uniref:Transmembrane protein, putative n=1 Tax=Medicago truncatula TaxID=3880 RepID=G7J1U3_MEDTR|nr:transmembrane protein, putative [Medicago truncatula]
MQVPGDSGGRFSLCVVMMDNFILFLLSIFKISTINYGTSNYAFNSKSNAYNIL